MCAEDYRILLRTLLGILFGNLLEDLPNRNCCGIHSVIFLCGMVFSETPTGPPDPQSPQTPQQLSGIVSCDAAAIRIRIRIARCQRPAKRQKHKPCETQARFSLFSPLLLVGSKELVLQVPKRGQFHAAIRVTI